MIQIDRDIHSLTDFKRNTGEFVRQMKETGSPVVLTVNGKAELVVQDATSYQALLDAVERAQAVEGVRRGLEQMKQGEGQPADEAFAAFRKNMELPMPDVYRIILQPEAYDGMENAYNYIEAEQSSQRAHEWVKGLMEAINSLQTFPRRCPLAPENDFFAEEIRHLLYGKGRNTYRVLFTIVEDAVSILHIRHGAQDTLRPDNLSVEDETA